MRTADIEAGTVYAVKAGSHIVPGIILGTDKLYHRRNHLSTTPPLYREAHAGARPHAGRGYGAEDVGYPMVRLGNNTREAVARKALEQITLHDFLTTDDGVIHAVVAPDGTITGRFASWIEADNTIKAVLSVAAGLIRVQLDFAVLYSVAHVLQPWDSYVDAQAEADKRYAEHIARADAERAAVTERVNAIIERFRGLGINVTRTQGGSIMVSADDAEQALRFLEMLRSSAGRCSECGRQTMRTVSGSSGARRVGEAILVHKPGCTVAEANGQTEQRGGSFEVDEHAQQVKLGQTVHHLLTRPARPNEQA